MDTSSPRNMEKLTSLFVRAAQDWERLQAAEHKKIIQSLNGQRLALRKSNRVVEERIRRFKKINQDLNNRKRALETEIEQLKN